MGTALSYYYQGGIPQFAIIDGVAGTNYNQWGVVGTQLGYGSGLYMSFRSEINSITWAGDANGDGRVDINDLSIVLASFGKTAGMSWSTGDFTGDGKVDVNDLTIGLTTLADLPRLRGCRPFRNRRPCCCWASALLPCSPYGASEDSHWSLARSIPLQSFLDLLTLVSVIRVPGRSGGIGRRARFRT